MTSKQMFQAVWTEFTPGKCLCVFNLIQLKYNLDFQKKIFFYLGFQKLILAKIQIYIYSLLQRLL